MAQFSWPWPDTSGAEGDGRKITAEEFAALLAHSFSEGVLPTSNRLVVTSSGANTIDVATGEAIVRGRYYNNSAALALTPASAGAGTTRKDAVVLECDWGGTGSTDQYTVRAITIEGTAGAYPALTQTINVLWQHLLYHYTISDAGAITAITDCRTPSEPLGSHVLGELREVYAATLGGSDGRRLIEPSGMIHEEWVNCDGGAAVNGVTIPDLRDKVLAGVSAGHAAGTTGGADTASLAHTHTEGSLAAASHTHGAGSFAAANHTHAVGTIAAGSHTHAAGTLKGPSHTHAVDIVSEDLTPIVGDATLAAGAAETMSHTHRVLGTSGVGGTGSVTGSTAATTPAMSGATAATEPAVAGTSGATAPAVSGTTASAGSATQDMRQATAYVYRFIYVGW